MSTVTACPTFADLLRQHLAKAQLTVSQAASLWHMDPDTLYKALRGEVAVPRTKIGLWSLILERPEEEILTAVNGTRAVLGRTMLAPPREDLGIPINTVEQTEVALERLTKTSDTPVAAGQNGASSDVMEVVRG
jgi:hypothetical protein